MALRSGGIRGEDAVVVRRPLASILVLLVVSCTLPFGSGCSARQQVSHVIADSVRDFSGVQGNGRWSYGYWDRTSDRDGVYDPASDFWPVVHFGDDPINGLSRHPEFSTGQLWYLEDGRYYTSLWAEGGHPHGTMDLGAHAKADHWVVRRWVSSVDSDVEILGHAGKVMPWGENWRGDVHFEIVVGGTKVFESVSDDGGDDYSVRTAVQVGAPVDFLIGPGSGVGVIEFTGTIKVSRGDSK